MALSVNQVTTELLVKTVTPEALDQLVPLDPQVRFTVHLPMNLLPTVHLPTARLLLFTQLHQLQYTAPQLTKPPQLAHTAKSI